MKFPSYLFPMNTIWEIQNARKLNALFTEKQEQFVAKLHRWWRVIINNILRYAYQQELVNLRVVKSTASHNIEWLIQKSLNWWTNSASRTISTWEVWTLEGGARMLGYWNTAHILMLTCCSWTQGKLRCLQCHWSYPLDVFR